MKPVIALQADIFSEFSGPLNLAVDVDVGDAEAQDDPEPFDVVLVEEAYRVCSAALGTAGSLPEGVDRRTIQWLERRNIVDVSDSGHVTLTREAIQHGTLVSGPVPEKSLRSTLTTLELQLAMSEKGWKFVQNFKRASISRKRAAKDNPSSYYSLLEHFHQNLIGYEDQECFHHKQGDKYYLAVEAAIIFEPTDVVYLPPYQTAGFYVQMQKFLAGEHELDPRENPQVKALMSRTEVEQFIYIYIYGILEVWNSGIYIYFNFQF